MPRKLFKKGHKKLGGRKKGTPNRVSVDIKMLLSTLLSPEELAERWIKFLNNRSPIVRWRAFELYHHYLFNKPIAIVAGEEAAPPILVNVSAIPQFRLPLEKS